MTNEGPAPARWRRGRVVIDGKKLCPGSLTPPQEVRGAFHRIGQCARCDRALSLLWSTEARAALRSGGLVRGLVVRRHYVRPERITPLAAPVTPVREIEGEQP